MNTALPVYRGELQCRLPGMAIETFGPDGKPCAPGVPGELVCLRPFPCQPVGFWPLEGYGSEDDVRTARERYKQAYFSEFEGVWCEFSLFRVRSLVSLWRLIIIGGGLARRGWGFVADHGDHVLVTPSRAGNGGGLVMLGRSDGVL
jgi:acetoacetyl-CoA synthetase